jgi:hypothetical protein
MTIRFADHDFDGPHQAVSWKARPAGGVYAVLVYDPAYRPQPYRVIHFGQAQEFFNLREHRKYSEWLAIAGSESGLYVATHGMPGATELTRMALERYLIHYYHPECNELFTAWGAR